MLRPSYSELMDVLNEDRELDSKITSRYTIVIAAAKRARQIVNGAVCDGSHVNTDKAVSIAINELERGLIKLYPEGLPEEYFDLTYDKKRQEADAIDDTIEKVSIDDLTDLDLLSDDFDDLSAMEDFDDELDAELPDESEQPLEEDASEDEESL